jgi:Arc/MetJ family transcription regulator
MASLPYFALQMKMTMHIDEDVLDEVVKITGAPSKTKAVAMALNELARKSRLKALLAKGSGVPADQLDKVYDPKSLAVYRVAEDRAPYGKRRPRR